MNFDPKQLLTNLPEGLRSPLFDEYRKIVQNFSEHRWEPAELNGGKFCEIVYTIIDGALSGSYASSPHKPKNLTDACRKIEQIQSNPNIVGDRSFRVLISRLLPYLYDIRNNRGVGHVGGDVDPNFIDATAVLSCCGWVMAELIRISHNISLEEAQKAADTLVEKRHPIVWQVGNIKRVLDPTMTKSNQVLTLLYSAQEWSLETDLRKFIEYSNASVFKNRILKVLHKNRLIEYDSKLAKARITPLGIAEVEEKLLI